MATTISLDERIAAESETTLDDEQKNDYTAVDGLIAKMKLTAAEYDTLCAFIISNSTSDERFPACDCIYDMISIP